MAKTKEVHVIHYWGADHYPKKAPESVPANFSWKALWDAWVKGSKPSHPREGNEDIIAYKRELARQRRGRR